MTILLPKDSLCEAKHAECWSFSIFGMPKMTVICGNCYYQFYTRDYRKFNAGKSDEKIVANCPKCGKWNKINLRILD